MTDHNQPASGADEMPDFENDKEFVFDPATGFFHADDGGAPEHGCKWIRDQDWQLAAHATPEREVVEADRTTLRHVLKEMGGMFHGPNVETLVMEEQAFWRFIDKVLALSAQPDKPVAQVDVEGLLLIVERLRSEAFLYQGARHEEISRIMLKGMAERGLLAAPSGKGDAEVSPKYSYECPACGETGETIEAEYCGICAEDNGKDVRLIRHAARPVTQEQALPPDVVSLVIAARNIAYDKPTRDEIAVLDRACEAFADRVPWDDEPDDEECQRETQTEAGE